MVRSIIIIIIIMVVVFVLSVLIHSDYENRKACYPKDYRIVGEVVYCKYDGALHKPGKVK